MARKVKALDPSVLRFIEGKILEMLSEHDGYMRTEDLVSEMVRQTVWLDSDVRQTIAFSVLWNVLSSSDDGATTSLPGIR